MAGACPMRATVLQTVKHRQRKGRGFPGTGRRLRQQVAAAQEERDRFALDRRRLFVAERGDRGDQCAVESGGRKAVLGSGGRSHTRIVSYPPGAGVSVTRTTHGGSPRSSSSDRSCEKKWTIRSSSSILAAMGMKSVWLSPLASLMRRSHDDDDDWEDARPPSSDSGWRLPEERPLIAEMNGALAAEPRAVRQHGPPGSRPARTAGSAAPPRLNRDLLELTQRFTGRSSRSVRNVAL